MRKCISPEFDEDAESCRECLFEGRWNDMPCHVPDTSEQDAGLLMQAADMLDRFCNKISFTWECDNCMYHDEETHICEVRGMIDKLREKAKERIK